MNGRQILEHQIRTMQEERRDIARDLIKAERLTDASVKALEARYAELSNDIESAVIKLRQSEDA